MIMVKLSPVVAHTSVSSDRFANPSNREATWAGSMSLPLYRTTELRDFTDTVGVPKDSVDSKALYLPPAYDPSNWYSRFQRMCPLVPGLRTASSMAIGNRSAVRRCSARADKDSKL
jgi:hypothetical protein